jgi:twitching motility two-component system response regulator PilG
VPVIMLSSKDGLFDKARGRMVGSQDYLTKPFTKEQLLRAVESFRRVAG